MDRVIDIPAVVAEVVGSYATFGLNANLYHFHDPAIHADCVVVVPHKRTNIPHVIVMTRIVGDMVVIETDRTDRPVEEALTAAGIPRNQIVLAYAGETTL